MDVAMIVTSESEKDAASENRTEETTSETGTVKLEIVV